MSLQDLRATGLEGASILRKEGLLPFVRAGLRELNLNHRGFYYYLSYLYKRAHCSYRTAEPFTVIYVNPVHIHYRTPKDIDRWENIGEVRGGDWDCSNKSLEDGPKYRSVVDRFKNGTSWDKTDIYQDTIKCVNNNKTHWNGCRNVNDIENRVNHLEQLYKTIYESGFKSQSQLHDKSVKSIVLSGSFDRSKTDIAVAIGRDGEFLFVDGNHRLAIAYCLDLESIPVRVVVRHAEWQDIRDEIKKSGSPSELPSDLKKYATHPDVNLSCTDQ